MMKNIYIKSKSNIILNDTAPKRISQKEGGKMVDEEKEEYYSDYYLQIIKYIINLT